MSMSFNSIPIDVRVPGSYIENDNSKAFRGLSGMPTKVLVIGQKLAAAPAAPLVPVLITSKDQANAYFGRGSMLAHMMEKFKAASSLIEVHAIAQVDNGAGVSAAGAVTFNGAATASGTLNLYIGGRRVQTAILATDADSAQATKLVAAINAQTDLPVTAVVDGVNNKKVNITARNKGECGNTIDLRLNYYADETTPSGVVATITAMAGGTGNPSVNDVLSAIGDEWYTDFVMAYTDSANIVSMETELTDRFGPMKMIDGHLYMGVADTHANLITKGQGRNHQNASIMGVKKPLNPSYEWAAVLGAVCAYNLKNDPARPVQTLELPGLLPPAIADQFSFEERDLLLRNGISTYRVTAGGTVVIERIVTTYRTNAFGASDPSYLDIETVKTLSYLRYDTRNYIALTYPRYKLADDGTRFSQGQAVVTPSMIRASLISRFILWEEAGLVEDIEQFKRDLIVERNTNDPNRADSLIPLNVINQFRVLAAKNEFRL